jgi:hypothetical protein
MYQKAVRVSFQETSKLAEERFIRSQAAKASAATGKELKAGTIPSVSSWSWFIAQQLGKN